MGRWVTVNERKDRAIKRISDGVTALRHDLELYAKLNHGSFVIFGSIVRGDFRFDSDVDILVDFPSDMESAAWSFAEETCRKHGLSPDVRPKSLCEAKFVSHIIEGAEVIHG